MEIEKLRKEDFGYTHLPHRVPSIRFMKHGAIVLSRSAVLFLKLQKSANGFHGIAICHDKKDTREFFITRDDDGWQLRSCSNGQAVFNCAALSHYVLSKTFDKCAHAADAIMVSSYTFRIASLPVDDDKNNDVYALLRKKT